MNHKANIIVLAVIILFTTALFSQKENEPMQYGGVATCKACHLVPKSGAQFKVWASGPHAKAFETLKSEQAVKIAQKAGIQDATKSGKCLKCHVTAHGVDAELKGEKLTLEEGVSCEACHGAGSAYKGRKVMQDIWDKKVDGAEYGLINQDDAVCLWCHNQESPTFKGFDYKKMVTKIAHPVPKS